MEARGISAGGEQERVTGTEGAAREAGTGVTAGAAAAAAGGTAGVVVGAVLGGLMGFLVGVLIGSALGESKGLWRARASGRFGRR